MIRELYGFFVVTAFFLLLREAHNHFEDTLTRGFVYYVTFVFFAYWYVPVLNVSSYTAGTASFVGLTLLKDVVWVGFVVWTLITGQIRKIGIPRFSLVLVSVPALCLPAIIFGNTTNTVNLIKSVVLYAPLIWVAREALEGDSEFLYHLLKTGSIVGALAILQLLLGIKTYLEIQLGSFPRAVGTLGGPTPLAMALLFVCLAGLSAILHRQKYRTFHVYSMIGLSVAGTLVTTSISPVVALIGALSVLVLLYLAVHPSHVDWVLKSTTIAACFGFLVAYTVPLVRYRILGAFGFALDNPVALATYRSRQARTTDFIGFIENIPRERPFHIVFGHTENMVQFEPIYLEVIYNQGVSTLLILVVFLFLSLLFSIRTYLNTRSPRVQTIGFLTAGYILMFTAANVGSPIWTMFPANVILYLSVGWLVSTFGESKAVSEEPSRAKAGRFRPGAE